MSTCLRFSVDLAFTFHLLVRTVDNTTDFGQPRDKPIKLLYKATTSWGTEENNNVLYLFIYLLNKHTKLKPDTKPKY